MSVTAPFFDIKHFAVHDGPGIRTTFFLKGCPLHCLWCQNPESIDPRPAIAFTAVKCIGCGACAATCGKLDSSLRLPRRECSLCGSCVKACPTGAREFVSKSYTPDEVLEIALEQRPFFEASGGGVTFSGGECLTHPEFMSRTLELCSRSGISAAVDTCGAVSWECFIPILPYTSLFLYDIKVMDEARHRAYTGMDNRLILSNLKKLCAAGAKVIIRIPLIPGYTDSPEDIAATGRFIAEELGRKVVRVELLPYNPLAASKYGSRLIWSDCSYGEYPLPELKVQEAKTMEALADILHRMDIPVYAES